MAVIRWLSDPPPACHGGTLLLPVVSLASVPGLAADLLIATLELRRTAVFTARYHAPVIGALDGQQSTSAGITTPVELFQSSDGKLSLLHQRSPPLRVHKDAFVEALRSWIESAGFEDVLILGSMDGARRSLTGDPSPFRRLGSSKLAQSLALPTLDEPLNSAGLTRRLLAALPDRAAALLIYVVEADNNGDAEALAEAVVRRLPAAAALRGDRTWVQPRSWRLGLFGKPVERSLY